MKTFNEYILGEAEAKPLKWAIDKKQPNNILLKDGGKVVYRMFKYQYPGHETHPYGVYVTKNSVNDCTSVEKMIEFLKHMISTANMGRYALEAMPKDVLAWLDK